MPGAAGMRVPGKVSVVVTRAWERAVEPGEFVIETGPSSDRTRGARLTVTAPTSGRETKNRARTLNSAPLPRKGGGIAPGRGQSLTVTQTGRQKQLTRSPGSEQNADRPDGCTARKCGAATGIWRHPEAMVTPRLTVQPPTPSGGRLVTMHVNGCERRLGTAHSDHDLVVLLSAAGLADPERVLDDPSVIEWQGAQAHVYQAG